MPDADEFIIFTQAGAEIRKVMGRAAERWMRLAHRLSCFSLAAVMMLAMGCGGASGP